MPPMTQWIRIALWPALALILAGCSTYDTKRTDISESETGELVAHAPKACPDWSSRQTANYGNSVMSNFGCAHANNIAKMVEDPLDLLGKPRSSNPDAQRSADVVRLYKESAASGSTSNEGASQASGGGN